MLQKNEEKLTTQQLRFKGALLERGFWVYVCRVKHKDKYLLYVGRTGDSSSRFAASPFSRLGRHLDLLPSAPANMLVRHLRDLRIDPRLCTYLLIACGPLYPEQENIRAHRRIRDRVALIEAKLAQQLKADGYKVVGSHPVITHPLPRGDVLLFRRVLRSFRAALNA